MIQWPNDSIARDLFLATQYPSLVTRYARLSFWRCNGLGWVVECNDTNVPTSCDGNVAKASTQLVGGGAAVSLRWDSVLRRSLCLFARHGRWFYFWVHLGHVQQFLFVLYCRHRERSADASL